MQRTDGILGGRTLSEEFCDQGEDAPDGTGVWVTGDTIHNQVDK